jgi:hypothetical protein
MHAGRNCLLDSGWQSYFNFGGDDSFDEIQRLTSKTTHKHPGINTTCGW